MFPFHVLTGKDIRAIIEKSRPEIFNCVRDTYLEHHRGETVNLKSSFLYFPEKSNARVIALPALLGGDRRVAGIKWIASFPDNVGRNIPRASAVLILNDVETGYPIACLEAAQISAARTAASAVLGAQALHGSCAVERVAVIGAGVISRAVLDFLSALGWTIGHVAVYDTVSGYAEKAAGHADTLGYPSSVADTLAGAIDGAGLVILTTTAREPHIVAGDAFTADQTVLNISLRDIAPEIIASSYNVLDDLEHCLNACTSPHLAVQKFNNRDFIHGTMAQLLLGEIAPARDKPRIFSPFGLGVLDVAVGFQVFTAGAGTGHTNVISDFFTGVERW